MGGLWMQILEMYVLPWATLCSFAQQKEWHLQMTAVIWQPELVSSRLLLQSWRLYWHGCCLCMRLHLKLLPERGLSNDIVWNVSIDSFRINTQGKTLLEIMLTADWGDLQSSNNLLSHFFFLQKFVWNRKNLQPLLRIEVFMPQSTKNKHFNSGKVLRSYICMVMYIDGYVQSTDKYI